MTRKNLSAFTLIELLVVISIITLLVSILLPSLNQARELAKSVVCTSNAKSIGTGLQMYASLTEDMRIPYLQNVNGLDGEMDSYWNGHFWADLLNQGQLSSAGAYKCPSEKDRTPNKTDRELMHYGLNLYLYGFHINNWGGIRNQRIGEVEEPIIRMPASCTDRRWKKTSSTPPSALCCVMPVLPWATADSH